MTPLKYPNHLARTRAFSVLISKVLKGVVIVKYSLSHYLGMFILEDKWVAIPKVISVMVEISIWRGY